MSEELQQVVPIPVGQYLYYRLGSTTIAQLRNAGIVPKRKYEGVARKKPDGLVTLHGRVVATVEYKGPGTLKSEEALTKAIGQEIEVARALCRIFIVTDGTQSFWLNALNGESVLDSSGSEVRVLFHPPSENSDQLAYLLDEIDASLTLDNSKIRKQQVLDPTPLAERLWQTIWVATGKSPVKCLYNVVELFIFKFLSDLRVLPDDIAFNSIYLKSKDNAAHALEFYAKVSRARIMTLFPSGTDGTTIIDGTIFVDEDGEPNLSQSILFRRSLEHLHDYTAEFGSFTQIDKQFKTKLYESFLGQEVQALGQYFTPRAVVQSVIRMAGLDSPSFPFQEKRICDPFCGVGGFLMEIINLNGAMRSQYDLTSEGKVRPSFVLHGFDKGFERDDERTIILAKANMLIYLAEILFANPTKSTDLATIFNSTFTLFRDNLGTFGHILDDDTQRYDLIFSNPPYVTRGSSIIKEELRETPRTVNRYPINGLGLESLALEWIVQNLRSNGRAFVVVPDGILGRIGGKKLRDYVLRECYLDAIVSLPDRTFFANAEHTYILAVTKKNAPGDVQKDPVLTYLVSNIGELLTSVRRTKISENDLPEMERLFRMFMANRQSDDVRKILGEAPRCKIRDIQDFSGPHWVIDRWWTRAEKIEMGALDEVEFAELEDVRHRINKFQALLESHQTLVDGTTAMFTQTREVALGDTSIFRLLIGRRVLKRDLKKDGIPVYSANVVEPMGYWEDSNIEDFEIASILWGIDGNFGLNMIPPGTPFRTTDHCGVIRIRDPRIDPEYLLYALVHRRTEESFDRSFRPALDNMRRFSIQIPVDDDGFFDLDAQRRVAAQFMRAKDTHREVKKMRSEMDRILDSYITRVGCGE